MAAAAEPADSSETSSGPAPSDVVVTEWIDCSPDVVFDNASATETLPDIFKGSGAVPGVVSARMEREGVTKMTLGETRVVTTTDGNTVREHYIVVERPHRYAYEMTDLNPPLSMIMSKAVGRWEFAPEGSGTRVTWRYSAFPSAAVARPATALVTRGFLKSAMQDCLAQLKTLCEKALPPRWVPDGEAKECQAETCSKAFGTMTRRHHCRACAGVFCGDCTGKRKALPAFGIEGKVRVCDRCFEAPDSASRGIKAAVADGDSDVAAAAPATAAAAASAAPEADVAASSSSSIGAAAEDGPGAVATGGAH